MSLQLANEIIAKTYRDILPGRFNSGPATVMLLAIGLQESRFRERVQLVGSPPRPVGPARGFWQFERGGGVRGVMTHPSSARYARAACEIVGVPFEAAAIHQALGTEAGDLLAVALARLLLFTDPRQLPAPGDIEGAWDCYLRLWRPGRPHPASWPPLYQQALGAV